MLDPLQPAFNAIYPSQLTSKITVERRHGHFQRCQALFDLAHILTHFAQVRSDGAHVLENEIVQIVDHGRFFLCLHP